MCAMIDICSKCTFDKLSYAIPADILLKQFSFLLWQVTASGLHSINLKIEQSMAVHKSYIPCEQCLQSLRKT